MSGPIKRLRDAFGRIHRDALRRSDEATAKEVMKGLDALEELLRPVPWRCWRFDPERVRKGFRHLREDLVDIAKGSNAPDGLMEKAHGRLHGLETHIGELLSTYERDRARINALKGEGASVSPD